MNSTLNIHRIQKLPAPFTAGSSLDLSSGDVCKLLSWPALSLTGAGLVNWGEVALEFSVVTGPETVGVRVVLTSSVLGVSESVGTGELIAAAAAELVVEVVSAQFRLVVVVVVVSVGFVSLDEVEGAQISAELEVAG